MKKLLLSIAFLAIGMGVSNAQDVKFGAKAGLNIANVNYSGDGESNFDSRISFHVGGMAEIKLTDKFAVQPELLYSAQGATNEVAGVKFTRTLDYINVPVMAKYYVAEGFSLEAGPQLGFLIGAKVKNDKTDDTIDYKDEVNGFDFGLNFGAGYTINESINLGVRYNLGLTDLVKDRASGDDSTVKNGVIQISVGYFF